MKFTVRLKTLKGYILYSQGKIQIVSHSEIPSIDLKHLQKSCQRYEVTSEQCYHTF